VLHWAIALLIIGNLALGLRMGSAKGLAQFELFQLHKSIGIAVLGLTVARIAWRVTHRAPRWPDTLSGGEQRLARLTHGALYVLMMALPITGWIVVSASKYNIPTVLFGHITWPHIEAIHAASPTDRLRIEAISASTHEILAWSMIALVALHILGAVKHILLDDDSTAVFGRMLPVGRNRGASDAV
jgi:cytochrome b561